VVLDPKQARNILVCFTRFKA